MADLSAVSSKTQMMRLLKSGRLGNTIRLFANADEASRSHLPIMIRSQVGGGGKFIPHVPPSDVKYVTQGLIRAGHDPDRLSFNEAAPDDRLLIQGCVKRSERYYDLEYSTEPNQTFRQAMRQPKQASGLTALSLLRSLVSPSDLDDLISLMDDYPDAIIEFGAYAVDVGGCPRRNTVIWEVRNY